ncbi:hypothetical protein Pcinc_039518, partial [Petrolisthes cinctipes]
MKWSKWLCSEDEERLVRDLFRGYNKLIRPVENMTYNVDVAFGLAFIQLINVRCCHQEGMEGGRGKSGEGGEWRGGGVESGGVERGGVEMGGEDGVEMGGEEGVERGGGGRKEVWKSVERRREAGRGRKQEREEPNYEVQRLAEI